MLGDMAVSGDIDLLLKCLRQGIGYWNDQRPAGRPQLFGLELPGAMLHRVDLRGADLRGADLAQTDLQDADLSDTYLMGAHLTGASVRNADLHMANLTGAFLGGADLRRAQLSETNLSVAHLKVADLRHANLSMAEMHRANLTGAKMHRADLTGANLTEANLTGVNLYRANLTGANLTDTSLTGAKLIQADLTGAILVRTRIDDAHLSAAKIYGASVWDVRGVPADQADLVITPEGEADVTVDNLKVAQFIYLLLSNDEIRDIIDTITSKVVLILGRFTPEHKLVLDAIRVGLRERGFSPVLFDFDPAHSRDLTETVTLLARMSRFIIADLTEPSSIPLELQSIVPDLAIPVRPLLLSTGIDEFAMFRDLRRKYHWVLPVYRYDNAEHLMRTLDSEVIDPANAKAKELRIPP
jgi:uncharacterized protein YjbI with pentapeptide repeats